MCKEKSEETGVAGLGGSNKLLWNQPVPHELHKLLTQTKTIPQKAARESSRELWKCQVFTFGKLMGGKAAPFTAYPVSPLQLCHPEGKLPPLENLAEELLEQGVCWWWRWWVERRCSIYWSTTCLPLHRRSVGAGLQRWWYSRSGRKWEVFVPVENWSFRCAIMVKLSSSKFCWLLWKFFCLNVKKKKKSFSWNNNNKKRTRKPIIFF